MNLYFDNAATSYPKPITVSEAISSYLNNIGGPYGRSFYNRAVQVSRTVEDARDLLAQQLNVTESKNIVFTSSATMAINLVVKGAQFDRIFISPLEHNAVWRPITKIAQNKNVPLHILPSQTDGIIDLGEVKKISFKKNDLVIINHQSNVNGLIQPIDKIRSIIKEAQMLIDASQTFGNFPIDATLFDFLAFTGHKGLLGPPGIGGLYGKNLTALDTLIEGGTGSNSDELTMPPFLPDHLEAGTPNIVGIFGLKAAIENRPEALHSRDDFRILLSEIKKIAKVKIYQATSFDQQGELFSINLENLDPSIFAQKLNLEFGIETRPGLHCAPEAHKKLGTYPRGTVRLSLSSFHDKKDFEYLITSLAKISSRGN